MNLKKLLRGASASVLGLAFALPVLAATVITVTPTSTQGWTTADTRVGGMVEYVEDATAPSGTAALELTTNATTTAKAQYMHTASGQLDDVTELSYWTKQVSASFAGGLPSYQLVLFLNGGTDGFTTMVYEPYQNPLQGAIVPNTWQSWDVDQGLWWSSRAVTCSNGGVVAGGGGPAIYTLAQLKTMCPEAEVGGFGVNIGSNNPSYVVRTDLVNFNGTSYNFELFGSPTDKDQCKNGGFANYRDANGNPFTNQGQCVSLLMSGK